MSSALGPGSPVLFLLPSTAPFAAHRPIVGLVVRGEGEDLTCDLIYPDPDASHDVGGTAPTLTALDVPNVFFFCAQVAVAIAAQAAASGSAPDLETVMNALGQAIATNPSGIWIAMNETNSQPDLAHENGSG